MLYRNLKNLCKNLFLNLSRFDTAIASKKFLVIVIDASSYLSSKGKYLHSAETIYSRIHGRGDRFRKSFKIF